MDPNETRADETPDERRKRIRDLIKKNNELARKSPMDPNETLKAIRALVKKVNDGKCDEPVTGELAELVELVEALDRWLQRGGFRPDDWDSNRY